MTKRSFIIFLKSHGPEHPHTRIAEENYISLIEAMGKTEEEINTIFQEILSGHSGSK